MKEKIYTIPVNDGFDSDCECPFCFMEKTLEVDAINYVMGPSYMEDDVRTVTNKFGFCSHHVEILSKQKNALGLALMLHSHMNKVNKDLQSLLPSKSGQGLFKKKSDFAPFLDYVNQLQDSCYVCNRIQTTMERYLDTAIMLWEKEATFREKFLASKGFCTKHYAALYRKANGNLNGKRLLQFLEELNQLYFENLKRVSDDLDWFIKKFDYQHQNEPWKNSKDAVQRTIIKTNNKIL